MNVAPPNIPTPIRTVSTTSPPAMAHCPPGPHWVSFPLGQNLLLSPQAKS